MRQREVADEGERESESEGEGGRGAALAAIGAPRSQRSSLSGQSALKEERTKDCMAHAKSSTKMLAQTRLE